MSKERELLGASSIFAGLASADLDELLKLCVRRSCKARQRVFRKGDEATNVYLIISGRMKVVSPGDEGRRAALSIMGPGEVFGELSVLDGQPRSATVQALEPCELLLLPKAELLRFLERAPHVAVALLQVLARRLRLLSERVEDYAFLDVPGRLAKQLLRLAERYGRDIGCDAIRLELKLSQQELGNLVGATRESVNKQLRGWIGDGVIEMQDGKLVLLDKAALSALCR